MVRSGPVHDDDDLDEDADGFREFLDGLPDWPPIWLPYLALLRMRAGVDDSIHRLFELLRDFPTWLRVVATIVALPWLFVQFMTKVALILALLPFGALQWLLRRGRVPAGDIQNNDDITRKPG